MIGKVGDYELIERIGDGGMGTVYRGRDPRFDRPVAIKVIHPHLAFDQEVARRFKAEAVIEAKLQHPCVVTVYDFVATDDAMAIVMEYVAGRSLEQLLSHDGRELKTAQAVDVCEQLLAALAHAHRAGLVHRDVKPSNVLVTQFEDLLHTKLADFGVAKVLGEDKFRTATSAKMGTLAYMSPEQLKSPKNVDPRTDLYSVGVMLYEMLTGQPAFDADTEFDLMQKIISQPLDFDPSRFGKTAAWFGEVLAKATAKDPDDRFATAEEFMGALRMAGERQRRDVRPSPAPVLLELAQSEAEAGCTKQVNVVSNGTSRALNVKVPKRITSGTVLQLRNAVEGRSGLEDVHVVVAIIDSNPGNSPPNGASPQSKTARSAGRRGAWAVPLTALLSLALLAALVGMAVRASGYESRLGRLRDARSELEAKLSAVQSERTRLKKKLDGVALLAQTDGWKQSFSDHFSASKGWSTGEEDDKWWTADERIHGGVYSVKVSRTKKGVHSRINQPGSDPGPDLYVAVRGRVVSGTGQFGLFFRAADSNNFISFRVRGSRFHVARHLENGWTTLHGWDTGDAITSGWNKLAVLARGSKLVFFVNDLLVAEVEDDSPLVKRGKDAGMAISMNTGDKAEFEFDDFEIRVPR